MSDTLHLSSIESWRERKIIPKGRYLVAGLIFCWKNIYRNIVLGAGMISISKVFNGSRRFCRYNELEVPRHEVEDI